MDYQLNPFTPRYEINEMAVNAQSVRLFPLMFIFRCGPQMFFDIFQDNGQRLENSKRKLRFCLNLVLFHCTGSRFTIYHISG